MMDNESASSSGGEDQESLAVLAPMAAANNGVSSSSAVAQQHPYDFHVSGPRNLATPNWRDLIRSTWNDPNYKTMVMACFIQAVYLLELDRQDKRNEDDSLAPKWWKPFKYKLTQTLVDERDGSIYGAVLEWDRVAALSEFIIMRPSGAPRAVIALRGTLLKSPTIRRDIEDDLRFLAWESLKGSVRFNGTLNVLKSFVDRYGSNNVCIAGHSLGAGFALQVGKALAKEGVFVECHVFNPPSVSLAMSLKTLSERAGSLWNRIKENLPTRNQISPGNRDEKASTVADKITHTEVKKWVPNLYLNSNDYVCCYYTDRAGNAVAIENNSDKAKTKSSQQEEVAAKLFLVSKGPQKFLQAHGLEQWWSSDMELQLALQHSNLINRQLRSLYTVPPALVSAKP